MSYNDRGKRFINANSCTWNAALGYGREELIEAANRQMHELPFSSMWGLSHPKAIELGAKLIEITSGNFAHVYLGANGSEATETAMKMARNYHRLSLDPPSASVSRSSHSKAVITALVLGLSAPLDRMSSRPCSGRWCPGLSPSIHPTATAVPITMRNIPSAGWSVRKRWTRPSKRRALKRWQPSS